MNDIILKASRQFVKFWNELGFSKKLGLIGTAFGVIGGIGLLMMIAAQSTYQPLWTNLNAEDSKNIIRILREKNIPFEVSLGGKQIGIPPEEIHNLRLELASMGLPETGVVGYEIFDKAQFGTTSFVQKLNQNRALEGELVRTIRAIKGVRQARVHLVTPKKSPFLEDQKKPTASVFMDLEAGVNLSEKQIFGIGNLVARGVEGLEISDVVIVNSQGKVLSKNINDPMVAASANQMDFRLRLEHELEERIESILVKVVGEGKVVAKVSAVLDFAQVNEVQTTYDSEGSAIRSTDKNNTSALGQRPGPIGPAGARSNLPGETPADAAKITNDTKRTNEVVNYEIPQTVKRTVQPTGTIKKLTVAVLLDGKRVPVPAAAGQESRAPASTKVESWTEDQINQFKAIVSGSVGIDVKRGDSLEIKNMEFIEQDFETVAKQMAEQEKRSYVRNLILYSVIGLGILLFFIFAVRPFIKWMTENTIESVDTFLPQTLEELEKLQKSGLMSGMQDVVPVVPDSVDPEKVEGEVIKEKIISIIEANPDKAALVIKEWIAPVAAKKDEDGKKEANA